MDYDSLIQYLFEQLPVFQSLGPGAYKPGLGNAELLDEAFGHRHREFRTIHVAGTNGKGSTSHMLASVLMAQGYKVGLYTSPHLTDFRERIRVDGQMMPREFVVDFMERYFSMSLGCSPSFFELTTIMAFDYFASQEVDYAVIEVGLGGRLDTTNIISPQLCVITNISLDHTSLLGNTVAEIAREKAGLIKPGVPVVVSEADGEVRKVMSQAACDCGTSIVFAEDTPIGFAQGKFSAKRGLAPEYQCDLEGEFQKKNINAVMHALAFLPVGSKAIREGMADVQGRTGLQGRWMQVGANPEIVCDTGHNPGAWKYLAPRLSQIAQERDAHIVLGFANDKDIEAIFPQLPKSAAYYFVEPGVKRARPAEELLSLARLHALKRASAYPTVAAGIEAALSAASKHSFIYIGGSNFVVAEALPFLSHRRKRD